MTQQSYDGTCVYYNYIIQKVRANFVPERCNWHVMYIYILKLIMNLDGLFEGVSDSLRVLIDVVQTKPGHSEPWEVNT